MQIETTLILLLQGNMDVIKNFSYGKKEKNFNPKQKKAERLKQGEKRRVFKEECEENTSNESTAKGSSVLKEFEKKKKIVKLEEIEATEDQIDHINARFAPLLKIPYPEQLKFKYEEGKLLMSKICDIMSKANPKVKEWIDNQSAANNGEAYKMHDIIHKETNYDHYKSRIELNVGLDPLTQQPAVGFRCGFNGVAPLTDDLLTMPQSIIPHVRTFETFLKESSIKIAAKGAENDGVWKQLSFKVGFQTNEIMMIVGFSTLKMYNDLIRVAKKELRIFYSSDKGKGITSLYFQLIRHRPKGGPSFHMHYLMGAFFINEMIGGIKFTIFPQSQIPNSQWSAELVKDAVKKIGRVTNKTFLIDIGSPLASVSLCLSKECKVTHYLVGHVPTGAIASLQATAPNNDIENWQCSISNIASHLRDNMLEKWLKSPGVNDALIYIDPWSSLGKNGIHAVRNIEGVNRLLFLTCGHKFMLESFGALVQDNPQSPNEDVYVPVEAAVIDTYPHLINMSMFVLLERLSIAKEHSVKTTSESNKESS